MQNLPTMVSIFLVVSFDQESGFGPSRSLMKPSTSHSDDSDHLRGSSRISKSR